jgi:glycosyl transferase, family 25
MRSIADIVHVQYINLDHRTDRRAEVEGELRKLGILDTASRFPAIKLKDGRIGCTMSHLKCLQQAKENNLPHLMLVEDDIQFLNPNVFANSLNKFLSMDIPWDVILIAGNNIPPYTRVDETAVKVTACQTTTGYIVNGHYFDTLIENMRDGMKKLMHEPNKHFHYAVDKYWFELQKRDNWFLITPLSVTQRRGYSDIEKRETDFTHAMVDLDKAEFMRRVAARNAMMGI